MRNATRFSSRASSLFGLCALGAALFAAAAPAAKAQTTLAEFNPGGGPGTGGYVGQSFTLSGVTGGYTNITFNFYDTAGAPSALGTGFLFSSNYSVIPSGLSNAASLPAYYGYLGQATAANGVYSFGSSVVLEGGKQYYFYENAFMPATSYTGGFPYTQNGVYQGFVSFTAAADSPFMSTGPRGASANFRVTGTAVGSAVPEPGVWVTAASLGGTTAFGLLRGRRRTRAQK